MKEWRASRHTVGDKGLFHEKTDTLTLSLSPLRIISCRIDAESTRSTGTMANKHTALPACPIAADTAAAVLWLLIGRGGRAVDLVVATVHLGSI